MLRLSWRPFSGFMAATLVYSAVLQAEEIEKKTPDTPAEKKSDAPAGKDSGKTPDKAKKPVPGTEDWANRLAKGRKQLEDSYPWAAEQTLRRCFEEAKFFPKDDPRRIDAYMALAAAEAYLNHRETALPKFQIAERLIVELLGADTMAHVDVLLGIADCKRTLGRFEEAEPVYLQALDLAGHAKDSTPGHVGKVRDLVEDFYTWSKEYVKAEAFCKKALAEAEKDPKSKVEAVFWIRLRLANLILRQKRFEEGDEFAAKLMEECNALFGAESFRVADVKSYLANAYSDTGHCTQAIELFRGSISIYEKDSKTYGPGIGRDSISLSECLRRTKQYEEAEKAAQRAVQIREFSRAPPRIIESLEELAEVYAATKKWDQAIPTMRKAVALDEKYYGKDRMAVVDTTTRLAQFLNQTKQYEEAERIYRAVLETHEKHLGPFFFSTSVDRFWVAYLSARLEREEAALAMYRKAAESLLAAREAALPTFNEHERQAWVRSQEWCWEDFFGFCVDRKDRVPEALDMAVDAALQFQGSLLGMGTASREAFHASGDPKLKELAEQIAEVRAKIAGAYKGGVRSQDPVRVMQDLKARQEDLEGEFARRCAAYASERKRRASGPAEIRKAIPKDAVLVLVLRTELGFREGRDRHVPHYLAFVLESDGAAVFLDLGEAMAIEDTLAQIGGTVTEAASRLVRGAAPAAETAHQAFARKLSEQFLVPLYDKLKDKTRWFFCMDGPIATLSVGMLPEPGGEALVFERREVSYLTRASEILNFAPTRLEAADLRILADPDFDAAPAAGDEVAMRSSAFAGLKWVRLPGTREEADALAALFGSKNMKVTVRLGADATREALFTGPAPRFLHVATHGFSLPEKFTAEDVGNVRGLAGIVAKNEAKSAYAKVANLLVCKNCGQIHAKGLRTGLVLAGAGKSGGGVVLAEELQTLSLFGTEMVVLSACESGLGDIAAGEGVQGLRSAFLVSGARSLVTSLWKVPDRETKDLMCAFYRHVLAGERKSKALQQAMLELRSAQQKEKGGSHPFYWAGFILVGNPD